MIQVRATLTGDGGGYTRIEVTGHQGSGDGGDGKVCAAVTTLLRSQLAYLDHLAQAFPDSLSVKIEETETQPCPT
ncbi:ribosomal-processing cysteine protease Prp [Kineosporia sp. R_H_3]|uniref:ribosomal-processing cysteine protease Prp n=1 Tax=Kineosporia sp. R_H_3 TaxID=1961848 RepID=UPI000B4BE203|nr:ribosomal-processing cysteine protease Prp [Kineosporia sp. R_H_3]